MTTRPLVNVLPTLSYRSSQIGRTVRGLDLYGAAMLANITALARPWHMWTVYFAGDGDWCASYTRTHSSITQLAVTAYVRRALPDGVTASVGDDLAIDLEITDAAGTVVPSSDARIPLGFQGVAVDIDNGYGGSPAESFVFASGVIDVEDLSTTLTDPTWSLRFAVSRVAGTVWIFDRIEITELGRTLIDTNETYGVDPADFQPGQPQIAGSVSDNGALRLAQTIEGGIATQPDVLRLTWVDFTGAAIPQTASGSYAAMTNLEQSSTVPMRFRVPIRPVYSALASGGTTYGEGGRWRIRYYVAGGGTADVQLITGATGSPYAITGLTGAAWAWSAWQTCALPTSATDAIATLSIKGRTSAGALYVSAIHVQQT